MSGRVEYPDFVARFYDVVYAHLRAGVDEEFFLDEIAQTRGKTLEIGVGTGRFFAEALKRGADIYGIDVSRSMIERLLQKIPEAQHGRVSVQDGVSMRLPHRFQLIIAPFRVLAHVIEVRDQIELLNRIWEHLEPGGRLIFDLYVPDLRLLSDGIRNQTDFEGEYEPGAKVARIVSANADLINQVSHVTMKYVWEEGGRECEAEWQFDMRFFFRYEIEHLIRLSKLNLETIYGDYRRGGLTGDSRDFVVVCRR